VFHCCTSHGIILSEIRKPTNSESRSYAFISQSAKRSLQQLEELRFNALLSEKDVVDFYGGDCRRGLYVLKHGRQIIRRFIAVYPLIIVSVSKPQKFGVYFELHTDVLHNIQIYMYFREYK